MRPLALFVIAVAAVVAGAFVGASTNAINGAVSPTYFVNIMGWHAEPNVWLASVTQGIVEGSVVGILFSIVLTTTIGIVTRATCTVGVGLRWLWRIIVAIYATWALGGICGVAWAAVNPCPLRTPFMGFPPNTYRSCDLRGSAAQSLVPSRAARLSFLVP